LVRANAGSILRSTANDEHDLIAFATAVQFIFFVFVSASEFAGGVDKRELIPDAYRGGALAVYNHRNVSTADIAAPQFESLHFDE
jgi:hypothetical protein